MVAVSHSCLALIIINFNFLMWFLQIFKTHTRSWCYFRTTWWWLTFWPLASHVLRIRIQWIYTNLPSHAVLIWLTVLPIWSPPFTPSALVHRNARVLVNASGLFVVGNGVLRHAVIMKLLSQGEKYIWSYWNYSLITINNNLNASHLNYIQLFNVYNHF